MIYIFSATDDDILQHLDYANPDYRHLVGVDELFYLRDCIFSAFYGY